MATEDEIRLILNVRGGDAIRDLQENLAYTQKSLDSLKAAYEAGEITITQYLTQGRALTAQQRDLQETLEQVAQAQGTVASSMNSAATSVGSWGAAIREAQGIGATFTQQLREEEAVLLSTMVSLDSMRAKAVNFGIAQQDAKIKQDMVNRAMSEAVVDCYELADAYNLVEREERQVSVLGPQIAKSFDWTSIVSPKIRKLGADFDFATLRMDASAGATGQMLGKNGGFGRGVMQASFMIQDFTSAGGDMARGLMSIQNNIPMLLTGLGAGAGLAGVVSIVTVGIGLLVNNWDSIKKLWQSDETIKEAERMKKLAEQTKKVGEETEKLRKYKGAQHDESVARIEGAVKEVGFAQAVKDLQKGLMGRKDVFGNTSDPKQAEQLLAKATMGDKKAIELINDTMFALPSKLAKALEDPGGKKAEQAATAWGQQMKEMEKEGDERRKLEKERANEEKTNAEAAQRNRDEFNNGWVSSTSTATKGLSTLSKTLSDATRSVTSFASSTMQAALVQNAANEPGTGLENAPAWMGQGGDNRRDRSLRAKQRRSAVRKAKKKAKDFNAVRQKFAQSVANVRNDMPATNFVEANDGQLYDLNRQLTGVAGRANEAAWENYHPAAKAPEQMRHKGPSKLRTKATANDFLPQADRIVNVVGQVQDGQAQLGGTVSNISNRVAGLENRQANLNQNFATQARQTRQTARSGLRTP